MTVTVHRSTERPRWRNEWLDSRQSFPATGNFDLAANAHGLLMVHNEDVVDAAMGFDTHQHRDVEIVTWVLEGSLVHQDSAGNSGAIFPGLAQRMSSGTGIWHSEKNGSVRHDGESVHVVQMWIPPDEPGIVPSYQELDIDGELAGGGLVVVASGMRKHRGDSAIGLHNRYASLHAARLAPARPIAVPEASFVHVFVARGTADMEGVGPLSQGDAVRLTDAGARRISTDDSAELLIWEMHASFDLP